MERLGSVTQLLSFVDPYENVTTIGFLKSNPLLYRDILLLIIHKISTNKTSIIPHVWRTETLRGRLGVKPSLSKDLLLIEGSIEETTIDQIVIDHCGDSNPNVTKQKLQDYLKSLENAYEDSRSNPIRIPVGFKI